MIELQELLRLNMVVSACHYDELALLDLVTEILCLVSNHLYLEELLNEYLEEGLH